MGGAGEPMTRKGVHSTAPTTAASAKLRTIGGCLFYEQPLAGRRSETNGPVVRPCNRRNDREHAYDCARRQCDACTIDLRYGAGL